MPPKKVVEEERLGPWALGKFSSRSVRSVAAMTGWHARAQRGVKNPSTCMVACEGECGGVYL